MIDYKVENICNLWYVNLTWLDAAAQKEVNYTIEASTKNNAWSRVTQLYDAGFFTDTMPYIFGLYSEEFGFHVVSSGEEANRIFQRLDYIRERDVLENKTIRYYLFEYQDFGLEEEEEEKLIQELKNQDFKDLHWNIAQVEITNLNVIYVEDCD